jgi:DNA-binding NarL/FixJ family response regulator
MIRLLLADDHQLVVDGIRMMLEEAPDMQCIGWGNNGNEILKQLEHKEADVVMLDINMEGMNGLESCKAIHTRYPRVRIIALSMLKEAAVVRQMLKNGASGYLLKNAGKAEVLEAIRKVYDGGNYYSREVADLIMASLGSNPPKENTTFFPKLTRREEQVLKLIVDEYTTAEIADKLSIKFGTVETHRRNLLVKLGARNTAGLVRICLEYHILG